MTAGNAAGEPSATRPFLVWRRRLADTITPVGAALALMQDERGDFLLESVEGGETRARYSMIGLDPDLVFRADGNAAAINANWRRDRSAFASLADDSFAALRALVERCRIDVPRELPDVLACLVGYFGYETFGLVEAIPRAGNPGLALPDMIFVRPSRILIFDALKDEVFLVAPVWMEDDEPSAAAEARANDRLDEVDRALSRPAPATSVSAHLPASAPKVTAHCSPDQYEAMVRRAKDYIVAGDIFQVVLSQRFSMDFPLPPMALYRALRRINPSPFLFFLDLPGFALIGSSPEILVRARGGEVTVRPIAGTCSRGADENEDRANETALLADPKERAEHLMLLDLGRNDVGRVSAPGSVKVTQSHMVERYSHVMHIVSNVVGQLKPGSDGLEALIAGFPAGTVSGAPKIRACEIIAELEADERGPYAGGVGYFSPDGSMDSCIVLRTGIVKNGELHVQAGAGIVADSDPDYERRECEAKAGALISAAREAIRRAGEPGFGQ